MEEVFSSYRTQMRAMRLLYLLALLLSTLAEKGRDFYRILCVPVPRCMRAHACPHYAN